MTRPDECPIRLRVPRAELDSAVQVARYAEAAALLDAGWSRADVAAYFGIVEGTLSIWLTMHRVGRTPVSG
jgi:hypothetical protein